MLSVKPLSLGNLNGTIYDLSNIGDVVSKHSHSRNDVHITIVCRGKLKAYGDNWTKEAIAGQVLDFNEDQPHELMALEDNTRIINIAKYVNNDVIN
jgi:quercetin dioxygenase-like cupin family protein